MTAVIDRLRAALARSQNTPVALEWHERQRHRFLHEYHEMRARSGANLFRIGGDLIWHGRLHRAPFRSVEYAIRYAPDHPLSPPRVFVLAPAAVAAALPREPDGSVRVLEVGDHHPGLTAFDSWLWLRRMVRELDTWRHPNAPLGGLHD